MQGKKGGQRRKREAIEKWDDRNPDSIPVTFTK